MSQLKANGPFSQHPALSLVDQVSKSMKRHKESYKRYPGGQGSLDTLRDLEVLSFVFGEQMDFTP